MYEVSLRAVCHAAASSSVASPFRTAQMLAAAVRPPADARWTPDEKKGSMKASQENESKNTRLKTMKKPTSSITDDTPPRSSINGGLVAVIASRVDETDVSLLDKSGILEEALDNGCEWYLTEVVSLKGGVFAGVFCSLLFGIGFVGVHDTPDRDGAVVERDVPCPAGFVFQNTNEDS